MSQLFSFEEDCTQTQHDYTQQMCSQMDEDTMFPDSGQLASSSQPQHFSKVWGKLIPSDPSMAQSDLEIRPPKNPINADGKLGEKVEFQGMTLSVSDIFNEYILGRSTNTDIHLPPPASKAHESHHTCHKLLSNRHCKIYCALTQDGMMGQTRLEVFLEDCSANGTLINGAIRLRKGEKRLLNTGDEIALVSANSLNKIRSHVEKEMLVKKYSFTFINIYQQRAPMSFPSEALFAKRTAASEQKNESSAGNATTSTSRVKSPPDVTPTSTLDSSSKQKLPPARNGSTETATSSTTSTVATANTKPSSNQSSMKSSRSGKGSSSASPPPSQFQPPQPKPQRPKPPSHSRSIKQPSIHEWYDIRQVVGNGTCGEVRLAINRKTGKSCAVKVIGIKKFDSPMTPGLSLSELKQEAEMLQSLDHPYIVKLEDVFTSDNAIYLVMEYMQGGDLFDRVVLRSRYGEVMTRRTMRRMLSAVCYLHSKQIVHRDLKPENILLMSQSNDYGIKITDFGLAKRTNKDGLRTFCGTPQYFAPEVLKRRNTVQGTGRYGMAADMWSIGVILYVLLSGCPPFNVSESIEEVKNANISFAGERWADISSSAKDLCKKLLNASPTARLTVKQAMEHEWILIEDGDTHTAPLSDPLLRNTVYGSKGKRNRVAFGLDGTGAGSSANKSMSSKSSVKSSMKMAGNGAGEKSNTSTATKTSGNSTSKSSSSSGSGSSISISSGSSSSSGSSISHKPAPTSTTTTTTATAATTTTTTTATAIAATTTSSSNTTSANSTSTSANTNILTLQSKSTDTKKKKTKSSKSKSSLANKSPGSSKIISSAPTALADDDIMEDSSDDEITLNPKAKTAPPRVSIFSSLNFPVVKKKNNKKRGGDDGENSEECQKENKLGVNGGKDKQKKKKQRTLLGKFAAEDVSDTSSGNSTQEGSQQEGEPTSEGSAAAKDQDPKGEGAKADTHVQPGQRTLMSMWGKQ